MRLIDADALREDLRRFFPVEVLEGIEPKTLFAQIMHDIDNAPTVDTTEQEENAYNEGYAHGLETKRTQGEWICITKSTFPQYQPDEYKCSQCNKLCHIKYYFCPFCGADMRGTDNG